LSFEQGLHPSQVLVQHAVHPPAQSRGEQAQLAVWAQPSTHDEPAAVRHRFDLAFTLCVEDLRAADSRPRAWTVDLGVLDHGIANPSTELHLKPAANADRPGRQQLRLLHLGIPLRLIPHVHHEVEHTLRRCRDVDHILDHVRPKRNRAAATPHESVAM
jgi:hypothetical protein